MPRKSDKSLAKGTLIRFFEGDEDKAKRLLPSIPFNRLVRELVHAKLVEVEARIPKTKLEIDL